MAKMNTNLSNDAQWVTVIVVTYNHLNVNILVVIILTSTCVPFQKYCLDCKSRWLVAGSIKKA